MSSESKKKKEQLRLIKSKLDNCTSLLKIYQGIVKFFPQNIARQNFKIELAQKEILRIQEQVEFAKKEVEVFGPRKMYLEEQWKKLNEIEKKKNVLLEIEKEIALTEKESAI